MSKFTDNQRKLFIGIAIVDGAIGLVLLGLSLAGTINGLCCEKYFGAR